MKLRRFEGSLVETGRPEIIMDQGLCTPWSEGSLELTCRPMAEAAIRGEGLLLKVGHWVSRVVGEVGSLVGTGRPIWIASQCNCFPAKQKSKFEIQQMELFKLAPLYLR